MKLVFRTTPITKKTAPTKPYTPLQYYKIAPMASPIASLNAIESRWVLGGNMIERVRPSGEPCGSCGGR